MRKQLKALFFIAGLLSITVHAETIQLGGDSAVRTAGWLDLAGVSGVNNVQPISYTDTNGVTFTVTATANAGQKVNVQNVGLAVTGGSSDTRIDGSESLELALSVSGGNLASLSASFLVNSLLTGEGFDVTDGSSTVLLAEPADSLVEYGVGKELDGLAPLSESNVSTWSIQFSVNVGYPATKGILTALILDYTVAATTNPPPLHPLYAEADQFYRNTNTYDLTQETYTFSTLWSVPVQPEINFLPGSYHSPIATRGDSTFVLFVDPAHRMKIAQLTNGVFKAETFIDNTLYPPDEFYANHDSDPGNDVTAPDYHRFKFEDSHHAVALGIDEDGYLHLTGDMHNYPRWDASMAHLPLRYFDKNIMYWRSDNPLDISSFSFKGDDSTGACPPGFGFTYQFFFNDLNGKLHMGSRAHQWVDNSTRCATYSRYDADTGLWSIIGGPDPADPDSEPRTFYDDGREYDATNVNNKYSKTHPHGVFDRNNTMHLIAPLLADPTLNPWGMGNAQHFVDTILYAQSTNGTDFAKADGSSITLPATVNLTANRADIAYSSTTKYLSVMGNIAVDYQNNPYTVVRQKSYDPNDNNADNESIVIGWNGTAWTNYGEIVVATTDFRLVHDPAGVMSYIPDSLNTFYRFWHPTDPLHEVALPATWPYIKMIDYEYLKKTGNILGLTRDGNDLVVVKIEINNRPGMELIDPPADPYPAWTDSFSLSGTNALYSADPDDDGMDNLLEYALGGNPTNADAAVWLPTAGTGEDVGTNWLNYVYRRRLDAAARTLTYEVQSTTNLVSNLWTNTTEEAGTEIIDTDFESVTNRVSTEVEMQQFMRLEIGITE